MRCERWQVGAGGSTRATGYVASESGLSAREEQP